MHSYGKWCFDLRTFRLKNAVPIQIKFLSRGTTVNPMKSFFLTLSTLPSTAITRRIQQVSDQYKNYRNVFLPLNSWLSRHLIAGHKTSPPPPENLLYLHSASPWPKQQNQAVTSTQILAKHQKRRNVSVFQKSSPFSNLPQTTCYIHHAHSLLRPTKN